MTPRLFGTLPGGEAVEAYTLANAAGASLHVITLGGTVTALRVPDRAGHLTDVVLGFDRLEACLSGHMYFGALIGRVAGRTPQGRFTIDGQTYQLACNNGPNHLHGGRVGFDRRLWTARPVARPDGADSLRLTYRSPDGEEGYPGNVDLAVTCTLTAANEFIIETEATVDRATPVCLTHHSYFNLAGEGSGSVEGHELEIFSDERVPFDVHMTLSGRREPVAGTPADFRRARRLGDALPQLFKSHGDLYLLRNAGPIAPVARVVEPRSGRVLTVSTDEPCLQFYSAVDLDGSLVGKSGRAYGPFAGLCLECQGYADGVNHPELGDILVRPGQPQRRTTIYAFSTI
jgi:aldose 1-epimerase